MKRALGVLILILVAPLRAAAQAPPTVVPPVEAFGSIPIFSHPRLSPDGSHMAAIQSYKGRPVVVIYNFEATPGSLPAIVESPEWIVQDIRWVKNDALVLTIKSSLSAGDSRLRTWVRAIAVDADGKNAHILMQNQRTLDNNVTAAQVVDILPADPNHILMSLYRFHSIGAVNAAYGDLPFYLDLLSVDVKTGLSQVVREGRTDTTEWLTDGNGTVVARIDHDALAQTERLVLYSDGTEHDGGKFDASGDRDSGIVGVSEDGEALMQMSQSDGAFKTLMRRSLATGAKTGLFYAAIRRCDRIRSICV